VTDHRDDIDVIDSIQADDDAPTVWRKLGEGHVLRNLYPDGQRPLEPDIGLVDELVRTLDARLPLGVVMSVCVEAATALPLLLETARHSPVAAELGDAVARGQRLASVATTDVGLAGSALDAMNTSLTHEDDGGSVLRGAKEWITGALHASHIIVLTKDRPERGILGFSWSLVPVERDGMTRWPSTTSFPGSGLGDMSFDDVAIATDEIIGRRGRGLLDLALLVANERLVMSIWARALGRRVLVDTIEYLAGRSTGHAKLWDNPAIRARVAECVVDWRQLDALCRNEVVSPGDPRSRMVLKVAAAGTVRRIVGTCTDLRGAEPLRDGGLAELGAEAAMFGILGGTSGALLAGIADAATELLADRT